MKLFRFLLLLITIPTLAVGQQIGMVPNGSLEGNPDNLPVREYSLVLEEAMVNKAGKKVKGMTVNGGIPGPVLTFKEGEYAKITIINKMDAETSIHWHGILLPNFYDGVPYLNTPPVAPGESFVYEFELKQSGTYWYHSHTMLQEQSGVYGSIVIEPKETDLAYDTDFVLMLSDWTNEDPHSVLKNLKRGNEWYGIKKGTSTPLNRVIARGALGAQVDFWRQRMEGADIADIYYPAFLINGERESENPQFEPGERVRLRIINGAASSYFWLTFGGPTPTLVAADGLDIVPVGKNKTLIGNAETYDFIVTIPEDGKLQVKASAFDGSGKAVTTLGKGQLYPAMEIPRPDKIGMMKMMAKMDMRMGAPALKANPGKDERYEIKKKFGMQMNMGDMGMSDGDMNDMNMSEQPPADSMKMGQEKMPGMDHGKMNPEEHARMTSKPRKDKMEHAGMAGVGDGKMSGMQKGVDGMMPAAEMMGRAFDYSYLRSPDKTTYEADAPVRKILLNVTGNMNRYIWSFNGVGLSETDQIKIKSGEVTRITFNNLTMMHHPLHLHGHFFRVINKNGAYSPLKHTVNVAPMQEVTIEFYGDEYGDWFFHCHILYHMMGGMARIFSYDTPRDERLADAPLKNLVAETDQFYTWGMADVASQMSGVNLTASNLRNQFNLLVEYGYNQNFEAEVTYERYIYDWVTVFGGVNAENGEPESLDDPSITAVAGVRWLSPYLFNIDMRIDNMLRPRVSIGRSIMLFPRLSAFGYYEYQADFGVMDREDGTSDYQSETVWSAGVEYMLGRNFSLMGSYDNRFGYGGGLSVRF
ncbi:copper oxidase [Lewinellaceae bacterium SD302]|nr:copper oxidase [Lewinellaceae bacterium SD302]